ncbi:hypothetical protein PISMIDRAFT_686024, partial [Pisolithus microcarpus 441]
MIPMDCVGQMIFCFLFSILQPIAQVQMDRSGVLVYFRWIHNNSGRDNRTIPAAW